jgi:hypothetical protein
MRWKSESALRQSIKDRTEELVSEMMKLPDGASEPPEEMLTVIIELDDFVVSWSFCETIPRLRRA